MGAPSSRLRKLSAEIKTTLFTEPGENTRVQDFMAYNPTEAGSRYAMKKQSEALKNFRKLIEKDYRRAPSPKREKEKKNLLLWFVDNCPSSAGPELARKFKDYGIIRSNDFKQLKTKILRSLRLEKGTTYKYCLGSNEMESLIEEIKFAYASHQKRVIFFSKGEGAEMDSMFVRVRNSFAHGNYCFKNGLYYFGMKRGHPRKSWALLWLLSTRI